MNKADRALDKIYRQLGLTKSSPEERYARLNDIVEHLRQRNAKRKFKGAVAGRISEYLCQLALDAAMPGNYSLLSRDWKWLGDFSAYGVPFNILISIKSFTARERFIASGSRSLLTPTIGWCLLKEAKEWKPARTRSYVFAGFVAVYLPRATHVAIDEESRAVPNFNGRPLLRPVEDFIADMRRWQDKNRRIEIRKI